VAVKEPTPGIEASSIASLLTPQRSAITPCNSFKRC
jgi:hypothetical protein